MPRSSPCSWRRTPEFATSRGGGQRGDRARTKQPPPPNSTRPRQQFIERLEPLAGGRGPDAARRGIPPADPARPAHRDPNRRAAECRSVPCGLPGSLDLRYVGPEDHTCPLAGDRRRRASADDARDTRQRPVRISGEAFANVVEDTVRQSGACRRMSSRTNQSLEEAAYEGFHRGVAANFPAGLLDPSSEYLETSRPAGDWVSMPRGRRPRYRKYSRVYHVTITPQIARAVRTFGGRTLSTTSGTSSAGPAPCGSAPSLPGRSRAASGPYPARRASRAGVGRPPSRP